MLGFAVSGGLGRRRQQQILPTGRTISTITATRRTARGELPRSRYRNGLSSRSLTIAPLVPAVDPASHSHDPSGKPFLLARSLFARENSSRHRLAMPDRG